MGRCLYFIFAAIVLVGCAPPAAPAFPHANESPQRFGSARVPSVLPSWSVSEWDFDPQNATGCASDNNTCTSTTCGAGNVGPCVTWHEVYDVRLGCQGASQACPRTRQLTVARWLSPHTSESDAIYFNAAFENGGMWSFQGTPVTACTGTLSGIVAKNRSTGQLLNATLCPGLTVPTMIVNSTHPSVAWLYKTVSGNTWSLTRPMAAIAPGSTSFPVKLGVDTWANGDSYTALVPTPIVLGSGGAVQEGRAQVGFFNELEFYRVNIYDPATFGATVFGGQVGTRIIESSVNRVQQWGLQSGYQGSDEFNSDIRKNIYGGGSPLSIGIYGGDVSGAIIGQSVELNFDTIVGATGQPCLASYGTLYLDSGVTLQDSAGPAGWSNPTASDASALAVWGPGTLNIQGTTRFVYPTGSGQAATIFLLGTLQLNGQGKSCLGDPTVSSPTPACNITTTAANADSQMGASSKCLYNPGGASLCNAGSSGL